MSVDVWHPPPKQSRIGTSSLGGLKKRNCNRTNSSPTCTLSGLIGIGPTRRNGSASATGAKNQRGGHASELVPLSICLATGTARNKRPKPLGGFHCVAAIANTTLVAGRSRRTTLCSHQTTMFRVCTRALLLLPLRLLTHPRFCAVTAVATWSTSWLG